MDKIKAKNMSNFKGKVILKDFAAYDFFIPEPQKLLSINALISKIKVLRIIKL